MDAIAIATAEEVIVKERLREKLNQVNTAAQSHLSIVQDHVNFTLQKAYFKCAYECFDRRRRQEDIYRGLGRDVCERVRSLAPLLFTERLTRSLMVCQDKFESAKLQKIKTEAAKELESCVDQTVQEHINSLPHVVGRLKASLSIRDQNNDF